MIQLTYNWIKVPENFNPKMIISAFDNPIDYNKVDKYTEDMLNEYDFEYTFPPIMWFPSIIDEDMVDNEYFLTGEPVSEDDIWKICWYVTDWHHRVLSAINANKKYIDVELDRSTITIESELELFDKIYK